MGVNSGVDPPLWEGDGWAEPECTELCESLCVVGGGGEEPLSHSNEGANAVSWECSWLIGEVTKKTVRLEKNKWREEWRD